MLKKNLFLLEKKYDENGNIADNAKIFKLSDVNILTLQGNGTVTIAEESSLFEIIYLDGNTFKSLAK